MRTDPFIDKTHPDRGSIVKSG